MGRQDSKTLQGLAAKSRYPLDAFHFVRRGLDFTVHRAHKNPERLPEEQRHVTGQMLSHGLREFAVDQYGYLARTVLSRWRIARTEDFGEIVFAMVNGGLMQATEGDTPRDFHGVYTFDEAFGSRISLDRVHPAGVEVKTVEKQ